MPNVSASLSQDLYARVQARYAASLDRNFSRCLSGIISAGLVALDGVRPPTTRQIADPGLRSAVRLYAEYAFQVKQGRLPPNHVPWNAIVKALRKAGLLDPFTDKIIGDVFRIKPFNPGPAGEKPTKGTPAYPLKQQLAHWQQREAAYLKYQQDLAAWQENMLEVAPE